MKKLFAFILVLTLVLGMSTITMAETSYGETDQETVVIKKIYEKIGDVTKTPGETFDFTITNVGVTDSLYTSVDMPSFTSGTFSIAIVEGATSGETTLNLPDYDKVGIFTYKITETSDNTAGVTYDNRELFLTIYVTTDQDGKLIRKTTSLYTGENEDGELQKVDHFTNEFKAGNLAIKKEVTGNMGEVEREFNVKVTLTALAGKTVVAPVTYIGGKYVTAQSVTFDEGVATIDIQLKHGHTVIFKNLPYDTTYEVVEDDYIKEPYNYDNTVHNFSDDQMKIDSAEDTVTITNHKEEQVPTGINLDSLPYLIILAVAIGGLILFVVRKRLAVN